MVVDISVLKSLEALSVGTLSYGNLQCKLFKRAMDDIQGLSDCSSWEHVQFDVCGCRVRPHNDEIVIEQTSYARAMQLTPLNIHRRPQPSEPLATEDHRQGIAQRAELGWLA